ncbi:hypothetical protein [Duncaniella muris]|nr:hypothetical protein [Duncaniella muris]
MTKKVAKKKVILTLCKVFPVTHQRAKQPTGFEEKLNCGEKIHTIRGNNKGVWDSRYADIASGGKYLSIREWEGRPYNSQQREIARRDQIGMQKITMTYGSDDAIPQAWVDGREVPVEALAKNDGLSVEDFVNWFFGSVHEGNVFEGVVIHFTNFRY